MSRSYRGEPIVYQARAHPMPLYALLIGGLISAGVAVLQRFSSQEADIRLLATVLPATTAVLLALVALWWRRALIIVTEKTLLFRTSVGGGGTIRVPLEKVKKVEIMQSRWGKRYNFGTLSVKLSVAPHVALFPYAPNPGKVKQVINEHKDVVDAEVVDPQP